MNNDNMKDEYFSWINHISENFVGILLLLLAIIIICVVEYVTRLNSLFFPTPSPIPGAIMPSTTPSISFTKKFKTKGKKFKK
jgi:hypothetical protein